MRAIADTKDALTALLEDGLTDVEVTRGIPEQLPSGSSNLYLLGAENVETHRPYLGLHGYEFDVRFILECHHLKANSSRSQIEGQMWDVAGDLEDLIAGSGRFGQYVTDAEVRPSREQTGYARDGWLSRLYGAVHVRVEV